MSRIGDRNSEWNESIHAASTVKGSYPAPTGPDWGWRTVVDPGRDDDSIRLIMYNISPEGEEFLAVEAEYSRQA